MLLPLMVAALLTSGDRPDIVVEDFEGGSYGKWAVTGSAFGAGPAKGTLPNQMAVTGYRGRGLANSYVGGDTATGSLTSPAFRLERRFLRFLIGGGRHPGETGIRLMIDGQSVRTATGKSTTPQDSEKLIWEAWDVSRWQGKMAVVEIYDSATGGWGHINVDEITQSDRRTIEEVKVVEPVYQERFRPQFHFTAKANWLNDPNGLVYADGEYHLFFQRNPFGIQWGNMHWGHAVSPDLVHWKELPIALSPDAHGTNYSGSAVVDTANTSGLGTAANPPIVAIYTGAGTPFTQCIASSTDRGRTWKTYAGNPVISHIAGENRDPKVFWHGPTHQWVMALYLDGDEFAIFGSPDLKAWHELSRLHLPGSSECPELFEMPVQGAKETRWIFYGGNFRYLIGRFDGKQFVTESGPFVGDHGANFYASQTYNSAPDGRRIQIGWMNGGEPWPGMPFNQQMSFPTELKLVATTEGLRLTRNPVQEIEKLRAGKFEEEDLDIPEAKPVELPLKGGLYDIEAKFRLRSAKEVGIRVGDAEITVNVAEQTISCLGKTAQVGLAAEAINIRVLVDRTSLEVFVNGGILSMTSYRKSGTTDHAVSVFARGGKALVEIEAFRLRSAWR